MGNFFKALTGNPQASRDLVEQVNTFRGAVDGLISRAAGNELLSEMDNVEPGKSLDESAIRRIALKYKLTPDKMNQLAMQLYDSGAIQQKQRELRRKAEDDMRMDSFREQERYKGKPDWFIQEREKKKIETEGMPATVAPPKTRQRKDGDVIITEEWDATRGGWKVISSAPRFKKDNPSSPSSGSSSMTDDSGNPIKPEKPPRVLPANKVQEIGNKKQLLTQYDGLSKTFNPQYGGAMVGGPTATKVYEKLGVKQGRVNWWKEYKALDAKLRNDLFGASLTPNEQKAWDAITVSENSSDASIVNAIKTRTKIARQALQRELDSYEAAGYNVGGLREGGKFKILKVE